jgi:tight adherence protein C
MTAELALALTLVFAAVALATGGVAWLVLGLMAPERRRLAALAAPGSPAAAFRGGQSLQAGDDEVRYQRFLKRVPKSPREMGRLRNRLARAGLHGAGAVAVYSISELLLPVLVAGLVVLVLGLRPATLVLAAALGIVGYMTPGLVLQRLIAKRQRQIRNGLPDAIDLLIVCVEAGSSLDQAVVKASDELAISYPALAQELRYVNTEIKAGKPRLEAFKNFAERTKVDDVRALVSMMVQTDRFGTSIAQALRTFADAARVRRRQEAEERAGKLGVKLLFPLVFCLFPAMFVVLLAPAVIRIYRVLAGTAPTP